MSTIRSSEPKTAPIIIGKT